jgi:4-amino-4-deoxy-L-arabinose transferase-like glycosyltransferase
MPSWKRPLLVVLVGALATLAVATAPTPLWDEDEARFAAIARSMVETGDWVVPMFNGTLAVDKPVLMHWCMAACMKVFGINEFAARLPSVIATLLTALALFRAGRRWFDDTTGVVAALAYVGCLLVSIEAHAATPDAILTALTAWATLLVAESVMPGADGRLRTCSLTTAASAGLLLGLAVVCKGPIGFVGPLAVLGPWAWCLAIRTRAAARGTSGTTIGRFVASGVPAAFDALRCLRPVTLTLAALAAAAPWYVAVTLRTDGAWTTGFFFVHNVGRFMAPMEKHSGGALFHPLTMLVGFYPWSCFLPFALAVAAWRVAKGTISGVAAAATLLTLVWLGVWVGGFSAAATKLPNYVLPAYPAAAFLVAIVAVDAARKAASGGWPHPRWMATGLASLVFGGAATAVTVMVAARYGIPGAEAAAAVGLIPIVGAAACWMLAGRRPLEALAAFTATGLVYAALAVGPAQTRLATANTLPRFVQDVQRDRESARLGTYLVSSPNVVFYARHPVSQLADGSVEAVAAFFRSAPDTLLLVPEDSFAAVEPALPPGFGVVGRTRPVFRPHDLLAVGRLEERAPRTATRTDEEPAR